MCCKRNRRLKCKHFEHDYMNKSLKNIEQSIYNANMNAFDDRKCNLNQKRNSNKYWCECKNLKKYHECKKYYIWNPATCNCKNGKYLASIIDDAMITCDELIHTT